MTATLHMSVLKVMLSKLITSGATNSAVPNSTCMHAQSNNHPTNRSKFSAKRSKTVSKVGLYAGFSGTHHLITDQPHPNTPFRHLPLYCPLPPFRFFSPFLSLQGAGAWRTDVACCRFCRCSALLLIFLLSVDLFTLQGSRSGCDVSLN